MASLLPSTCPSSPCLYPFSLSLPSVTLSTAYRSDFAVGDYLAKSLHFHCQVSREYTSVATQLPPPEFPPKSSLLHFDARRATTYDVIDSLFPHPTVSFLASTISYDSSIGRFLLLHVASLLTFLFYLTSGPSRLRRNHFRDEESTLLHPYSKESLARIRRTAKAPTVKIASILTSLLLWAHSPPHSFSGRVVLPNKPVPRSGGNQAAQTPSYSVTPSPMFNGSASCPSLGLVGLSSFLP